jgi:hypothetical protein
MTERATREEILLFAEVETRKHIDIVRRLLQRVAYEIIQRGETHDESKLSSAEMEAFAKTIPRLKGTVYDSDEYKEALKGLGPALDHHYANNRHHPEHFGNGISGMTLVDIIEMFFDWEAACKKHKNSDLMSSVEINVKRFGIEPQLAQVLRNTAWRRVRQ